MGLPILDYNVGDSKTLRFQLRESDKVTPVNIAGLTFIFFARDKAGDSAYTISPVTATITDAAEGRFEFDVVMPADQTDSLYWITREDGDLDTFPPSKGTQILVREK